MRLTRPALHTKARGDAVHDTDRNRDMPAEGLILTQLARLVDELLDAHADTADLAAELAYEPAWAAHLEYLRALRRNGKEMLARASLEVSP
jgi:predicted NAD/FAD-dependent oxidoreductase